MIQVHLDIYTLVYRHLLPSLPYVKNTFQGTSQYFSVAFSYISICFPKLIEQKKIKML